MTIDDFISALSEAIGEPLMWEDDSVVLEFDDDVAVTLEYESEEELIHMYSEVAAIPERTAAGMATALLASNLFGLETGGSASLAYEYAEEKLLLWDKFPLPSGQYENFQIQLTVLRDMVGLWRQRIREGAIGSPPSDDPPAFNSEMMA